MIDDKIHKVTEDVSWIGVLDKDIVTFDIVMETLYGTTYNSYFINAEKKTVVETVKEKFWDVFLDKLNRVTDPSQIDYIILNHTEPDHSGSLANLLKMAPKAIVVCSGNGYKYLTEQVGTEFPHLIVKDGDTLDLGNKTLRFISAPNLHWPDSMLTYLPEDRLLFTCDLYGEHFCREEMFDDLAGDFNEAFKYYFDVIMKPFSKFVIKAVEKTRQLQIEMICPGHGVILRSHWKKYVDLTESYAKEALQDPAPNTVLLAYVSAYGNTRVIAEKIAEGIRLAGPIEVDVCDIEKVSLQELEQKLIHSEGIIIGSPTFNQNILIQIYQLFGLLNPIRDKGKPAASFGSYGWSGEGVKIMNSNLANLKLKVVDEGLAVKFMPHNEMVDHCLAFGRSFGEKLLNKE